MTLQGQLAHPPVYSILLCCPGKVRGLFSRVLPLMGGWVRSPTCCRGEMRRASFPHPCHHNLFSRVHVLRPSSTHAPEKRVSSMVLLR